MRYKFQIKFAHPFARIVIDRKDSSISSSAPPSAPSHAIDQLSDAEIVELCVQDTCVDSHLFTLLIKRYEAILFRVAFRYLSNEADADDATQDTFLKAYRGLPGFRRDAEFKTWLFKILHNVCMTRLTQRSRRLATEIPEDPEMPAADFSHDWINDYEQYIDNDAIQKTLAMLNEQDRQVLILRHIAELSLQETADTLGIKLSATKMRFYRAQQAFTEIYQQLHNTSEPGDPDDRP